MAKMTARYVPIGQSIEETEDPNKGKSIQDIEREANEKKNGNYKPLGSDNGDAAPKQVESPKKNKGPKIVPIGGLVSPQEPEQESASELEDVVFEIQENEPEQTKEDKLDEELYEFDDMEFALDFEAELEFFETDLENAIDAGEIELIATTVREMQARVDKISNAFDNVFEETKQMSSYTIVDESKIQYAKELEKVVNKFEKLEQNLDLDAYHDEIKIQEAVDSQIRTSRYKKRKLEGLDDVGGIEGKDHNTSEKNIQIESEIDRLNNEVNENYQSSNIATRERRGGEGPIEKAAFVQDYEGSDLDNADSARDKLEAEILKRQEKDSKKKSKKKSEEEKIEETKERLRKKQEKRKAKRDKKNGVQIEDAPEIDLVGNQFDMEEMREERMDRLLEIKKLSAEKKELQKQKEKQRSKATKEFYKYKKVNKKSHIVGFKQQ